MRPASIWLASTALAFSLVLASACGDDTTGPGLGQIGDSVDGPDTNGGDAPDRPDGADATGDVAEDARPETADDSGPPVTAECGDGECQASESVFTCRDDCEAPASLKCLAAECDEALDACLELPACQMAAECLLGCADQDCAAACREAASGAAAFIFDGLAECGREAECLVAPPDLGSCPGECGEFVEGAECQCEEDCAIFDDCCEDFEEVCGGGPITCVQESCGEQLDGCLGLVACSEALSCASECEGPQCTLGCLDGLSEEALNAFQRVRQCANENCGGGGAECGNGECEQGENPLNCAEDCGGSGPECGNGECEQGENPLSCAEDCGGSGPECGNDTCESGENADNCPADCEGTPTNDLIECIQDECGSEFAACAANNECSAAIDCLEGCPADDQGCVTGCATAGGFGQEAIGLGLCVFGTSCLGGGGGETCGDGACEAPENAFTCPADCASAAECGDNVCNGDETAQSCPADCGSTTGGNAAECIADACPSEYAACEGNNECSSALSCLDGCSVGDQGCIQGCATSGGFGSEAIGLALCAFDTTCVSGGGGGNQPVCGDGACNGNETAGSCPADCGGGGSTGLLECLELSCEAELGACEAEPDCDEVIPCLVQCVESGSTGCTQACGDALQFTPELGDLGACGGQAGCGNPGG